MNINCYVSNGWISKNAIYVFSIYLRERWGAEGGRESQADSLLSVEHSLGLILTTLRSWPELRSRVGCLTNWATQVPQERHKLKPSGRKGTYQEEEDKDVSPANACERHSDLGDWYAAWYSSHSETVPKTQTAPQASICMILLPGLEV